MPEATTTIGRQVRSARRLRGLTQIELARRLRTSQSAVSRIENGDDLTIRTLRKVARALGCVVQLDLRPCGPGE